MKGVFAAARTMHHHQTPPAEIAIDRELVARLLGEQHPDLAHLPLRPVDAGWDNAMLRLGDRLAVRLPRRGAASQLIVHEQTWLPRLAGRLTLPVPAPCRVGTPARGYPWRWSIVPWLDGATADLAEPAAAQAPRLAAFLRSLHTPAPPDAPANLVRGVPLQQRSEMVATRMRRLAGRSGLVTAAVHRIWESARHAPIDIPPAWIHGDLHPRNVLVEREVISGIIDWGDLTAGDPATDLASVWMLFSDPGARQAALDAYGCVSSATAQRAKGWAVLFGVVMLDTGLADNPRNAAIGARTLRRVCEAA